MHHEVEPTADTLWLSHRHTRKITALGRQLLILSNMQGHAIRVVRGQTATEVSDQRPIVGLTDRSGHGAGQIVPLRCRIVPAPRPMALVCSRYPPSRFILSG